MKLSAVIMCSLCSNTLSVSGAWNPIKMSDIIFLKTEPNPTDLKIYNMKTQLLQFGFQNDWLRQCGAGFHIVSFTIHLPT